MDKVFIINACILYLSEVQVSLLLDLWPFPVSDTIQETAYFGGGVNMCVTTHLPSLPVIIITQCMFERYDNHKPLVL